MGLYIAFLRWHLCRRGVFLIPATVEQISSILQQSLIFLNTEDGGLQIWPVSKSFWLLTGAMHELLHPKEPLEMINKSPRRVGSTTDSCCI